MIQIKGNYSQIDKELDRLEGMPDFKTKVALHGVLTSAYTESQAAVHIETGSLKSSGKMRAEEGKAKWTGELEYGGPSAGVNNPVDYAIYEQRRGDSHDFLANTHMLHEQWVEAMKVGLA